MANNLRTDIAFFDAHLDELRTEADKLGRDAVLIHHGEVEGFFSSVVEAGTEGYRRFKGELFLARSVSPDRQVSILTSLTRA